MTAADLQRKARHFAGRAGACLVFGPFIWPLLPLVPVYTAAMVGCYVGARVLRAVE